MSNYDENEELPVKRQYNRRKKKQNGIALETVLGILSIIVFMLATLIIVAMFGYAGTGGNNLIDFITTYIGMYIFVLIPVLIASSYYLWKETMPDISYRVLLGYVLILMGAAALGHIIVGIKFAGLLGVLLTYSIIVNFSTVIAFIIALCVTIIGALIAMDTKPKLTPIIESFIPVRRDSTPIEEEEEIEQETELNNKTSLIAVNNKTGLFSKFKSIFASKQNDLAVKHIEDGPEEEINEETKDLRASIIDEFKQPEPQEIEEEILDEELLEDEIQDEDENQDKANNNKPVIYITPDFVAPPLELLNADSGKSGGGDTMSKRQSIKQTLADFQIPVEVTDVKVGPSVTQFKVRPATGVRVQRIEALKDNLQLALSTTNLHIQAPIPGQPYVGIEIPNEKKQLLGLRTLIESAEYMSGGALTMCIGKDIVGHPIVGDLAKMPHLLVAGATGTGKSVTIQNLIISLLYKNSPYDLKLIILDPKRVEFTVYNKLPHLYTPIIKDPKSAIKALTWAVSEMDRRYDILGEYGVANIGDYNKKVFLPVIEKLKRGQKIATEDIPPKMPYVVIVFDEYNDFMLSYPKEITPLITSLTQKARAAGMHLILATQRPDVKVITGTIKANIPSRIALKTTSGIDSRTILDQYGAEDLLGNGDMLYMNGSAITRVQAPFVSLEEVTAVINHIREEHREMLPDQVNLDQIKTSKPGNAPNIPTEEPVDDEDYSSAKDYIISTGKASTSSLQTAFGWGYNRAARAMSQLEQFNIIGPQKSGQKFREVLVSNNHEEEANTEEEDLKDIL